MDNQIQLNLATSTIKQTRQQWALLLVTLCTFFVLLGSRALNEPDEGRYSEIAREMIETGDWLVPHFWYLPHFDKPPMVYWLVAASMKVFGQNEWAVRLPIALAGLSGAWAAWLLGCSLGGRRVGFWSVLILQSNLLYFGMSRMLTTDIFLTQFVAWAIYFFWRSWLCLRGPAEGAIPKNFFWRWHLAAWLAVVFAFLTKGPVALAIPLVAVLSLVIFRWRTLSNKKLFFGGLLCGLVVFLALAAPWFLAVNGRIPHALNYMVFHQAAGHVLGTAIKNRRGFAGYFFVILAAGLMPWTWLIGSLWRRVHWRKLSELQKDGWIMLNVWAIFTFTLFSFTHSKLPAYILPIFPALTVMMSLRFFGEIENGPLLGAPHWIWRLCAATPLLLLAVFSISLPQMFHLDLPTWWNWQGPIVIVAAVGIFVFARNWDVPKRAAITVGMAIGSMMVIAVEAPWFDTEFKANQTLKAFGSSLQENYHTGDAVVCWGQFPEGLPFYSGGVISATNRPFFGGMLANRVPFEFPGNRERLGSLYLPDDEALVQLLSGKRRVLIIGQGRTSERFQKMLPNVPLNVVAHSGQWELFSNR